MAYPTNPIYKLHKDIHLGHISCIRYSKDGPEIETVIPYGNSSDPSSPHYTDQMRMYSEKKLKIMTLDKDEIFLNATNIYNPN